MGSYTFYVSTEKVVLNETLSKLQKEKRVSEVITMALERHLDQIAKMNKNKAMEEADFWNGIVNVTEQARKEEEKIFGKIFSDFKEFDRPRLPDHANIEWIEGRHNGIDGRAMLKKIKERLREEK